MSNRLYINIKDWHESAKENGVDIQDKEDIAKYIVEGHSPRQIGEWLVALIQNEESPPELLPDAKTLLSTGAREFVYLRLSTMKEQLSYLDNGGNEREIEVRYLNHWGGKLVRDAPSENGAEADEAEHEYESGYATAGDSSYLDNAIRRFHGSVWGHACNALKEIIGSKGDVVSEWEAFKQQGDDWIAERLEAREPEHT